MTKIYNIFIPELVPLDNKGEEAIVRGISDVLFPEGNCEIHLFDEVDSYEYRDGLHVYPVKWFISPWLNREFGLGLNWEKMRDSSYSVIRNGLHKIWPSWVGTHCSALKKTDIIFGKLMAGAVPSSEKELRLKQILDCDYIVAGHDGALDDRVCHVLNVMLGYKKEFGVFGVEFPLSFKSKKIVSVLNGTLKNSKFFYCRTPASYKVVSENFNDVTAEVLADPAFGMIPAKSNVVEQIVERNGLRDFFTKPVIMCTSCEPPPISRFCFEEVKTPDLKLSTHRQFFADFLRFVVEYTDANILFLPHAIGPGQALDDRVIARDIIKRSGLDGDRVRLLNDLLSAKELKGLISRADFLIAERIHSMIGAVGAHTPFLFLGSKTDRRINGIVCEMAKMESNVYFLNKPNLGELNELFKILWDTRSDTRDHLQGVYTEIRVKLEDAAVLMRQHILKEQQ